MASRGGRSARRRPQRLARRRAETQGFDRGGNRRSIFRSKWLLISFGIVCTVALIVPLVLIGGNSGPTLDPNQPPPVRRTAEEIAAADAQAETTQAGAPANAQAEPALTAQSDEPPPPEPAGEKPTFDAPPALALEDGVDYRATIELENGVVEIDLFEQAAPLHVNNFVFLADQGFYDGLTFHRVIHNFVAQGGDPTGTGTGGAGYTLPDETGGDGPAERLTLNATGVISMARGQFGASSSQFFITLAPTPHLDAQSFTAFGEVTAGFELLQRFDERDGTTLAAGPRIVSITIQRAP